MAQQHREAPEMTSAVFWAGTHTTTPLAMLLRMISRNGKVFAGAIATASSNSHDNQAAHIFDGAPEPTQSYRVTSSVSR
jgi:hypothetical protein